MEEVMQPIKTYTVYLMLTFMVMEKHDPNHQSLFYNLIT